MTKSKKSLIVGAALAGLLASGSAVQASNLLPGVRASFNAQDQGAGSDAKTDKKAAKDKHTCKGQNSCKGQGFKDLTAGECSAQHGSTTPK